MTIGLGTGSTAYWTIQKIGERVKAGLDIRAVATSVASETLARELNIPIVPFPEITHIDLDIDGADEVDDHLQLTKGGGGALLREKIIATASRRMIVVIDAAKKVPVLGRFPLPVEVVPFGWELTFRRLAALELNPALREKDGQPYITDNGNYILDCHCGSIPRPEALHTTLNLIPGVVENGLFIDIADTVIIGQEDGSTAVLRRS
ncbi:ribose 5-phosphate isomerase A [Compostibacter hankyongensis]|uniref:Ribose-5-phosphate isomerase A n=2 Tax=Compostibacter hankyongensis TaxID=1007089 RepID=A0ABP8G3C1_9BACT